MTKGKLQHTHTFSEHIENSRKIRLDPLLVIDELKAKLLMTIALTSRSNGELIRLFVHG